MFTGECQFLTPFIDALSGPLDTKLHICNIFVLDPPLLALTSMF
jgi:hypothetical protein